jgi:hypothetical protein
VLDRLSALQRHCLAALEVDCFEARPPTGRSAVTSVTLPPARGERSASATGPLLLLVEEAADRSAPLVQALARVLGAQVQSAGDPRPPGAALVVIGRPVPDAALTLPTLASLRADPRFKQRSWQEIRGFLRLRRQSRT